MKMPFAIPKDDRTLRERLRRAAGSSDHVDQVERNIRRLIARNRENELLRKTKNRAAFDSMLMTGSYLFDLQDTIRDKAPKTPDEEWSEEFCFALAHIEEAMDMAEYALIDCIGKEDDS